MPSGESSDFIAGSITVDAGAKPVSTNRMLFGQFLEHFHRSVYGGVFDPGSPVFDSRGFRLNVTAALRELKVPIVRWPGGCFASVYHWQEAVGPGRQPSCDKAWCVEELNTFGTDEFVAWCHAIGAETLHLHQRRHRHRGGDEQLGGVLQSAHSRPLARSRKHNGNAAPYNVNFWGIGNENYFGSELGAKSPQEWVLLVRESAKLCLVTRSQDGRRISMALLNRDPAAPASGR